MSYASSLFEIFYKSSRWGVGVFRRLGVNDERKFMERGTKMHPVAVRKFMCEFKQLLLSII